MGLRPDAIHIAIDADGGYRWNEDVVSEDELLLRLQAAGTMKPQPILHLNGDKSARYEWVIHVISLAQQSSLTKISFVTTPKNSRWT